MPGPPSTRPSNKTKHTALVAKKITQSRHPTEEVQAEKREKGQEKARKSAKQTAGKLKAARPTCMREPVGEETGANKVIRNANGKQVRIVYEEVVDDNEAEETEGQTQTKLDSNDPQDIVKSDLSGSKYQKSASETEDEDKVKLEDDKPDTMIVQKKGKKPKPGVLLRNKVCFIRDKDTVINDESDSITTSNLKRKATSDSHRSLVPKKAKEVIPTGVYSNWDKGNSLLPKSSHHNSQAGPRSVASSFSSQTTTSHGATSSNDSDAEMVSAPEDSSAFEEGGIESGDDSIEREVSIKQPIASKSAKGFCFRSIAKVEPIEDGPIFRKVGKRPTLDQIPCEAVQQFEYIKVITFDTAGSQDVWVSLPDVKLAKIWNLLLADKYPVSTDRRSGDPFAQFGDVKKLMNRSISNWINGFARRAIKVLDADEQRDLTTKEQHARFVSEMLGEPDQLYKRRPFLWKTTDKRRACSSANVNDIHTISTKPRGALMYAVQAVHRALLFSVTGEFKPPKGGKEFHFSQVNWGNIPTETVEADGKKKRKLTKRASIFKVTIQNLSDRHWEAILEGATEYLGKKAVILTRTHDDNIIVSNDGDDHVKGGLLFNPMFAG
ncbi:hypothetical protein B0H34DRAFT_854546 [Crassisporium funariophilum]|nr:hypothetical protein B0H34DRAFT_854546 [Crassisporium funariophilum]